MICVCIATWSPNIHAVFPCLVHKSGVALDNHLHTTKVFYPRTAVSKARETEQKKQFRAFGRGIAKITKLWIIVAIG